MEPPRRRGHPHPRPGHRPSNPLGGPSLKLELLLRDRQTVNQHQVDMGLIPLGVEASPNAIPLRGDAIPPPARGRNQPDAMALVE